MNSLSSLQNMLWNCKILVVAIELNKLEVQLCYFKVACQGTMVLGVSRQLLTQRSWVRIPGWHHSFIESQFLRILSQLRRRGKRAEESCRRGHSCREDAAMIGFRWRNLKREWTCRRELQLEESSWNVNKAAEQGEMERKLIILCVLL